MEEGRADAQPVRGPLSGAAQRSGFTGSTYGKRARALTLVGPAAPEPRMKRLDSSVKGW
jgi:hypothetical protein